MYKKLIIAVLILIVAYFAYKHFIEKKNDFQVFSPQESYGQRWTSRAGYQGITRGLF